MRLCSFATAKLQQVNAVGLEHMHGRVGKVECGCLKGGNRRTLCQTRMVDSLRILDTDESAKLLISFSLEEGREEEGS